MIEAPWTNEQVAALNEYQRSGRMHPFTCGNRGAEGHRCDPEWGGGDKGVLRATAAGWICPDCDYTQNWAHDFMLRGAPPPFAPQGKTDTGGDR